MATASVNEKVHFFVFSIFVISLFALDSHEELIIGAEYSTARRCSRGRISQRRKSRMFGSLGVAELALIFIVALIVFGPKRLPETGRTLGKAMGEFKKATDDFKNTIER